MPTPPTPPTYWWLTVRIDACRTRDQRVAAWNRRVALAAAPLDGPSLEEVEDLCEEHCFNVEGYESVECLQGLLNDAISRWGRPATSADGPAVPEGREPASVVGEPSDEELLKLARAELNNSPNWEEPEYDASNPFPYEAPGIAWLNFARAVLTRWGRPAPAPAEGEVGELVEWLRRQAAKWKAIDKEAGLTRSLVAEHFTRAADLLERQAAPVAVAVSGWRPIDTAPVDGTEVLASDCLCIDIVSYGEWTRGVFGWTNREMEDMSPFWWHPLPDCPPLPGGDVES